MTTRHYPYSQWYANATFLPIMQLFLLGGIGTSVAMLDWKALLLFSALFGITVPMWKTHVRRCQQMPKSERRMEDAGDQLAADIEEAAERASAGREPAKEGAATRIPDGSVISGSIQPREGTGKFTITPPVGSREVERPEEAADRVVRQHQDEIKSPCPSSRNLYGQVLAALQQATRQGQRRGAEILEGGCTAPLGSTHPCGECRSCVDARCLRQEAGE